MKTKKTYKTTEAIRRKFIFLDAMENIVPKLLEAKPFWIKKISIEEKISLIREIASAKAALWESIYKEYPELINKSASANTKEITEN